MVCAYSLYNNTTYTAQKDFSVEKKIKKNSFDARNKHLQAGENAKRKNVMREKFIFNNSCFFGA